MQESNLKNYTRLFKVGITLVEDFTLEGTRQNPLLTNIRDEPELLRTLIQKAKTLNQYYKKFQNPNELHLSVSTYNLTFQLLDQMKSSYKAEKTKLFLAAKQQGTYEHAFRACLTLYRETQEDSLLHTLFSFAEKSKAYVLREALGESQARRFSGIPDNLLQKERDLKIELNWLNAEIQERTLKPEGHDTTLVRDFQSRFFDYNRQYEALIDTFETLYPEYYRLKYDTRVATVDSIRQALPPGHGGLVEYFVGDSSIFIFHITPEDINIHEVDKPDSLEAMVSDLRNVLDIEFHKEDPLRSYRQYTRIAHELYNVLLKDVVKGDGTEPVPLIIVPDGPLTFVPFEALLYEPAPEVPDLVSINYRRLPYLLRRHLISYHYSGTLMVADYDKKDRKRPGKGCLAFAPVYEEETERKEEQLRKDSTALTLTGAFRSNVWRDIPWVREEVKTISQYTDGDFFIGEVGTEQNFKAAASDYQVLHLAMHGQADPENPLNSRLIFSAPTDSLEDGMLYAYELYGLELNADMVVLSACETGAGQLVQGEGIMSLGRGFMYAGTSSVAQTLWEVPDQITARLMEAFYKYLSEGMDKAAALRQAKLDYLSSSDISGSEGGHPLYWAAFTLYGDTDPIDLEKSNSRWFWMLLVMPIVFIGVWMWRRRTK